MKNSKNRKCSCCDVSPIEFFNRKETTGMYNYTNYIIPSKYGDLQVYYTDGLFGHSYYCVEVNPYTHYCGWTLDHLYQRLQYLGIAE